MLVLAPAADLEIRRRTAALAGRRRPIEVVTAGHREVDADLAACEADISRLAGRQRRPLRAVGPR